VSDDAVNDDLRLSSEALRQLPVVSRSWGEPYGVRFRGRGKEFAVSGFGTGQDRDEGPPVLKYVGEDKPLPHSPRTFADDRTAFAPFGWNRCTWPPAALAMKGSPVRVRASAFRKPANRKAFVVSRDSVSARVSARAGLPCAGSTLRGAVRLSLALMSS